MKIQIISDLHQEFGYSDISFDNPDLVILAGDTNLGTKGIEWVKQTITNKPVIYILGNHEYYKGSYPKTLDKIIEAAQDSNIYVLENNRVEFEGIRFHGTTLWTDFSIFGDPKQFGIICQNKMNDYKKITRSPSYSKLRTIDTYNMHLISKKWLIESLEDSKAYKNIVITHHAPSIKSVPENYLTDPLTAAYASNLEEIITTYQPSYWIHGHIHTPLKYNIGETQIICNPHGYLDEPYNGHEKELIVEV